MTLPKFAEIIEVGPRDGLQSQSETLSTAQKIQWITSLLETGLKRIEVGAFVSPKAVPAMADSLEVVRGLPVRNDVIYSALVPNEKGYETARESGIHEIAVFTATSQTFCQKNINATIEESLKRFKPVVDAALQDRLRVRAYVSTIVACPYEGAMTPAALWSVMDALFEMGAHEISLGDTLGVGNPLQIRQLFEEVKRRYTPDIIACHFHDTYGRALANIWETLQLGFTRYDASAGGLGGCPYAPGASGNVATDDLLDFFNQLDVMTGLDASSLNKSTSLLQSFITASLPSKVFHACHR